MKLKHCIVYILAASFASMALTYGYVKTNGTNSQPQSIAAASAVLPALITTARPEIRSFSLGVPWIGAVESRASIELTALVAGRVELICAEDQARIEKGRLVMRLGGPRVEAERATYLAEVDSLEAQSRLARRMVERLERSLKAQLATKDQVAHARDAQVRLETQLRKTRLSLKAFDQQVRISAPQSGIFTNRHVSVGQDVNAGQAIGEIIDTGQLRIVASIFAPQGTTLQGRQAAIRLDQNQVLTGLVQHVLPRASSNGAVTVWIQGPQIDKRLRPGQTVAGTLIVKPGYDSLAVPKSAIVYDSQEHPHLFVRKDGAYAAQSIRLGLIKDGWVEVLAGLEQDQFVVIQGAYELYYRHFNDQFKVED